MMTAFVQRWNRFWFEERSAAALGIVRIFFGVYLSIYALTYAPFAKTLFSYEGFSLPYFENPHPLFAPVLTAQSPAIAYALCGVFLLLAISFTVGFRTRLSAFGLLMLGLYFWQLDLHHFTTSYVRLEFLTLAALSLSGCGKALSMDMKRKHGSFFACEDTEVFIARILCIQLTITYFGVGAQKVLLPLWQGGEVLSYGFFSMWSTPLGWSIGRMNIPLPFWDACVELVKALEIMAPFGLWHRPTQLFWMALGAFFHISIALLMGIWWFVFLIPMYVLFLPEERTATLIKHIKQMRQNGTIS